jgi:hypothetical protein
MCVCVRFRVGEQNRTLGWAHEKADASISVCTRACCVCGRPADVSIPDLRVRVRVRARAGCGGEGMSAALGSAASVCRSSNMARLFFLLFVARAIHCSRPPAAHSHF